VTLILNFLSIILGASVRFMMRCYDCGRVMSKVDDKPETYECKCGYTVRRLTKEKTNLFVKVTTF
jgi:rRNA maturation endonuclease Nob1